MASGSERENSERVLLVPEGDPYMIQIGRGDESRHIHGKGPAAIAITMGTEIVIAEGRACDPAVLDELLRNAPVVDLTRGDVPIPEPLIR